MRRAADEWGQQRSEGKGEREHGRDAAKAKAGHDAELGRCLTHACGVEEGRGAGRGAGRREAGCERS